MRFLNNLKLGTSKIFSWKDLAKITSPSDGILNITTDDEGDLIAIGHDGTDGYIYSGNGDVKIASQGSNVLLTNSAGDDFGMLQLGGTTSSYPALKYYAGHLEARKADDSGRVDVYGQSLVAALNVTAAGNVRAGSAQQISWTSRTEMRSGADGDLLIQNAAQDDFNLLQLGGTTDEFPALKRVGRDIHFRQADDNDYASVACETLDAYGEINIHGASMVGMSASADGALLLTDEAGTNFDMLQFGGIGAGYPALKRNSTQIQTRLADDSGYATLATGPISANGNITFSATNGPSVINETSSDNNPTFCPYGTANSGLGGVYTRVVLVSNATAILSVEKYGFAGSSVKIDGTTFANSTTDDNILDIIGTLNGTSAAGGSDIFSALNIDITTTDTTEWDEVNLLRLREDNSDRFRISMDGDVIVGGLIQLGGTTNAYPAIKRVEDKISIRTADDAYGITNTGALEVNYTEIDAASYTTLKTDHTIGVIRTIDGACAITLGSICVFPGHQLTIIDAGGNCNANNITVDTEGTENINGLATFTMDADYESIQLISTGVDWLITSIT